MRKQIIHIGADHAGFELKEHIKKFLEKKEYDLYDEGAHKLDKTDDYPDFALKVAREVADNTDTLGILCCGSAQGMCIVANKVSGVRAVAPSTSKEAQLTRTHNNANVLCLAAWSRTPASATRLVQAWLDAKFSNEPRHIRRLKKITEIENHKDL